MPQFRVEPHLSERRGTERTGEDGWLMKRWGVFLLCLGLVGFAVMLPVAALGQAGPPAQGCERFEESGTLQVNGTTLSVTVNQKSVTVTNQGPGTVSVTVGVFGGSNENTGSRTLAPGESITVQSPTNPGGQQADVSHVDVCAQLVSGATTTTPGATTTTPAETTTVPEATTTVPATTPTTSQVGGQIVERRVVVVRGQRFVRQVAVVGGRRVVTQFPTAAAVRAVPFTGIDPSPFLTASGLLMSSGGGLLLASRRRRR